MEHLTERIIPDFPESLLMTLDDQHIVIAHVNKYGLESEDFSKCDDILQDEQMQKADVICLTETLWSEATIIKW